MSGHLSWWLRALRYISTAVSGSCSQVGDIHGVAGVRATGFRLRSRDLASRRLSHPGAVARSPSRCCAIAVIYGLAVFGQFEANAADAIIGQASVIDGDTLEIHGERIRLEGIDAPESRQTCHRRGGATVDCGRQAAFFLADLIGKATVTCVPDGRERYRRVLAHCAVGGVDISRTLVRAVWALAFVRYSREYEADEAMARVAQAGLWSISFVPPWEWRASRP